VRRVTPLFHFLDACNAADLMEELGRFLEYWYGPRRSEYGETQEALKGLALPEPLRRFYAFAGRWPSPDPGHMESFYSGASGHHLRPLDGVETLPDGRLDFFMEYQGDWSGLTLPSGDDPPVWICGCWEGDDEGPQAGEEEEDERIRQASDSLSKFLVLHVLMATLHERPNFSRGASERARPMVEYFEEQKGRAVHLWEAGELWWPPSCLDYRGSFYLFPEEGILVHRSGPEYRFGALHATGVRVMESRLG
jgi:hypothetical protein